MEADHGQLKRRPRPVRGLKTDRGATVAIRGHALVQNIRRGHYALASGEPPKLRLATAFDELATAIWPDPEASLRMPPHASDLGRR
jgi:predicted deacetylase